MRAQEKVTKEKGTPSGPVSGLLPADCAIWRRGSLTVHPWTATNARASCARPFGRILHPLAGPQGDPDGRAARIVRAEAQAKASRLKPLLQRGSGSARTMRAALPGSPSAPVDGGREGPQGRAHEVRAFAVSAGMRCRRTPAGVHAPAGQDARRAALSGVSFSLVSFSWTSKRKKPARRDAGRTYRDVGRLSRKIRACCSKRTATARRKRPHPALSRNDAESAAPSRCVRRSRNSCVVFTFCCHSIA